LPILQGFDDETALGALADRFVQQDFAPGEVIISGGQQADQLFLIAHGKVNKIGTGDATVLGVLADGQYFGDQVLTDEPGAWDFTIKAVTPVTVLVLRRQSFDQMNGDSGTLRAHVQQAARDLAAPDSDRNAAGEADIAVASGHDGEPALPATYADYEIAPVNTNSASPKPCSKCTRAWRISTTSPWISSNNNCVSPSKRYANAGNTNSSTTRTSGLCTTRRLSSEYTPALSRRRRMIWTSC
jgi:hypothetical protein